MLTWLDHLCRGSLHAVDEKLHRGDPRTALAIDVGRSIYKAQKGAPFSGGILEEAFLTIVMFLVADFMPSGAEYNLDDGMQRGRPLGLLLTRETANLLSDAKPIGIPDELWRENLGPGRVVYVDIPHGAIVFDANPGHSDFVQIRGIFAAPFLPPNMPGHTLFVVQLTDRGSEKSRGRTAGVFGPDGAIRSFGSENTGRTATTETLRPPFVHPMLEKAVLGRAGTFLRLVFAYHFFGPDEAKEAVAATPSERLRAGKPRKDESLFALTRLLGSDKVQRPKTSIPSAWTLTERQEVTGHFRLQAYGPGLTLRRLIWVASYERGPEDAPLRPQGHRL